LTGRGAHWKFPSQVCDHGELLKAVSKYGTRAKELFVACEKLAEKLERTSIISYWARWISYTYGQKFKIGS